MDSLSEYDKVRIFASLIMMTDMRIKYSGNKLTIILNDSELEKIDTYVSNAKIDAMVSFNVFSTNSTLVQKSSSMG